MRRLGEREMRTEVWIDSVLLMFLLLWYHYRKHLEEQSVYFNVQLWSTLKLSQGGKIKQKLKRRPWGKAACWFVPHDLLNLLSYSIQAYPSKGGTAHGDIGPSTSTVDQEHAPQARPRSILIGTFSQLRFLLPDISSLS